MFDTTRDTRRSDQTRFAIRSYVAPASPEAALLLEKAVGRSGSLQRILRLLGLPIVDDLVMQMHILSSYMLGCGKAEFLSKLNSLMIDLAADSASRATPCPAVDLTDTRSQDRRRRSARSSSISNGHGEERWLRARYPGAQGLQADGTGSHPPSRVVEAKPPKAAAATWPEIDRRSGLERRTRLDRRKNLVAVSANVRFGGERRSGFERRVDPPFVPTNISRHKGLRPW